VVWLHVTIGNDQMAETSRQNTSREKVARYRERMKARGYRQVSFWIPDTRTPEFIAEARRQAQAVANSAGEKEDLAFIEALADWDTLEKE